ncbi:MAG: NTP transferase domain-containing protein [Holophaga sp.]|nr:NTP transferase domain-containing protein [Holophaga sp.]
MLLLTGGAGRRFGAPKHLQLHPQGGSWAGYLVTVFETVFPQGPVQILGAPVPERPELRNVEDLRQGPARAMALWAEKAPVISSRWWVLACDQVRWSVPTLEAWFARARTEDPNGQAWVLAEHKKRVQYLGGFLGASLVSKIAVSDARSLGEMAAHLPCHTLPATGSEWFDVDCPGDLEGL